MRQNFGKITLLSVAVSSAMILSACSNSSSGKKGQPINPITPVVNTKPTYVNIMEISSISKDDVTINWLPAQDDNTPSSQIRYELHASDKADFTPDEKNKIYSVVGKYSAVIENKLTGGKSYYVRLVATDKDGNKTISEPMSVKVSDKDPVVNVNPKPTPNPTPTPTPTPNPTPTPQPDPNQPNVNKNKAIIEVPVDKTVKVEEKQIILPKNTEVPKDGGYIVSVDTEQPYLRKVVDSSVDKNTGETKVVTEKASLNEVVEQATISSAFKMSPLPKEIQAGLQTGLIQLKKDGENTLSWQSNNYSYTAGNASDTTNKTDIAIQAGLAKITGTNEVSTKAMNISLPKEITLTPKASQNFNVSAKILQGSNAKICEIKFVGIDEVAGTKANRDRISVTASGGLQTKHQANGNILDATQGFKLTANDTEPLGSYDVKFQVVGEKSTDNCGGLIDDHKDTVTMRVHLVPEEVMPNDEKSSAKSESKSFFKFSNEVTTTFDPIITFENQIGINKTYAKMAISATPNINQVFTIETRDAESKIDEQYDLIKPRHFHKVYYAGSVPVLISGEMTLKMRVTGKATGKVKVTEKLNLGYEQMEYGFEYRDGNYHTVQKATPNYYFTVHGEGGATAEIEVAVVPSLKVTAYEIATGRIVAEPYLRAVAGVDGHVDYVAGKDPDGYVGQGFDADYRLTEAYVSGGLNAYLAANLSVFDKSIVTWPNNANLNDVTKYRDEVGKGGYYKLELLKDTKLLGIPYIEQPTVDFNTYKPDDSRAILVQGKAEDIILPFYNKALISWQQWTTPRVLNTRSSSQDAVITREPSDWSKNWFTPKQAGTYTIRLGGYSSLGSWARQYKDVEIEITDNNNNGIMDYWEERYNLAGQDINSDTDGDGLTLLEEYNQGKNPTYSDNPAIADLPTLVINPARPIKGEKFSITVQGGKPENIGLITWDYDGKRINTSQPNIYQTFEHTTDKSSIDVVLTFLDKQGKNLGTRRQTVILSEKSATKPTNPSTPNIPVVPPYTGKQNMLPITGISFCSDEQNAIACSALSADWKDLGQDGEVQAGQPMKYDLVTSGGDVCIMDYATGLMWEQKTDDGGLRDKDNKYQWYDTNSMTNGGGTGFDGSSDPHMCKGSGCNTEDYIAKLNASNYCGYQDWKIPNYYELGTIIDYTSRQPHINYIFEGTQNSNYWSSTASAELIDNAWAVDFHYGGTNNGYANSGHSKSAYNYVRAVRSN